MPVWDELDSLLALKLFIGRSTDIFERQSEPVAGKMEKYRDYIVSTATTTLSI